MRVVVSLFVALFTIPGCGTPEDKPPPKGSNAFSVTAEAPSESDQEQARTIDSLTTDSNVLVPRMPVTADVMALQINSRGQDLVRRFREGISKHPVWWLGYAKQRPPGEVMPYHPNMGISEAENLEMHAAMKNMTLEKTGEATLEFIEDDARRLSISSIELSDVITNIVIDFEQNYVLTPYGRLERDTYINNTDPDSPTGPWAGPSWRLEQPAEQEPLGTIVSFALGRRSEDSRGVVFYKVRRILPNRQPEKIDLFLLYDATN